MDLRERIRHLTKLLQQERDCSRGMLITETKEEITDLLKKLIQYLKSTQDIEKSLTELPDTGQFLGRLCAIDAVWQNKQLYQAVMMCVMALYQVAPSTPLAHKAKEWALAQLQSTMKKQPKDTFPVFQLGINHKSTIGGYIHKMSSKVLPVIKNHIGEVQCVGANRATVRIPGDVTAHAGDTVKQITDILLSSPWSDATNVVWEDILWILSVLGTENHIALTIYEEISSRKRHGGKISLTKKGYKLLWISYLPSLEAEVLEVLDECTGVRLPSSAKEILNRSFLPEVCCEEPQLLLTVCQMCQTLIQQSGRSSVLIWVVTMFFHVVQEYSQNSCQSTNPFSVMYPSKMYQMCTELSRYPPGNDVDGWATCVARISSCIKELQRKADHKDHLQHIVLYHRYWYLKTIQICLHCHKKFTDGCSSLLSYFLEPVNEDRRKEMKTKLDKCICALRSLMNKVTLEYTDVLYVIQMDSQTSSVWRTMIGHLAMMFLFLASAGMRVFKKVLPLITDTENPMDILMYVLIAQEELDVMFLHWSPYKRKEYCDLIGEYVQGTKTSVSNKDDKILEEIIHAATDFLQKYSLRF